MRGNNLPYVLPWCANTGAGFFYSFLRFKADVELCINLARDFCELFDSEIEITVFPLSNSTLSYAKLFSKFRLSETVFQSPCDNLICNVHHFFSFDATMSAAERFSAIDFNRAEIGNAFIKAYPFITD